MRPTLGIELKTLFREHTCAPDVRSFKEGDDERATFNLRLSPSSVRRTSALSKRVSYAR